MQSSPSRILLKKEDIKAIIGSKRLKWRVKDGYFECNFQNLMVLNLVVSEKSLIVLYYIESGELYTAELWDLLNFSLVKLDTNARNILTPGKLSSFGIKILFPDIHPPNFDEFYPYRFITSFIKRESCMATQQHRPFFMLVMINGKKYVIQWSHRVIKTPITSYYDLFLSPPIPIDCILNPAVPYLYVNYKTLAIHYPSKKKDRGKPKEIVVLPPLERIYGYQLISCDLNQLKECALALEAQAVLWPFHEHHKDGAL